jgi:hypothetical protein
LASASRRHAAISTTRPRRPRTIPPGLRCPRRTRAAPPWAIIGPPLRG